MNTVNQKEMKKGVSRIGLRYLVFGIIVYLSQLGIVNLLKQHFPEQLNENITFFNFLVVILSMYVIACPLLYVICRDLPTVSFERKKLKKKQWMLGAFFCAGICFVGTIIGTILNLLAVLAGGANNNGLAALMLESKPFMRILTVGILAPIFEELIFRKFLIDHLAKYGEFTAILASGIMFGLYHGNFSQCFFATGLGLFFAYLYVKTGQLRYSISYHMLINLTTSVITVEISGFYMKKIMEIGPDAVSAGSVNAVMGILPAMLLLFGWLGILVILGIVGTVLLCVNLSKFTLEKKPGTPTTGQSWKLVLLSPGMLLFFGLCVARFLETYLLVFS